MTIFKSAFLFWTHSLSLYVYIYICVFSTIFMNSTRSDEWPKKNPGHYFAQKYIILNCRYFPLNHLVMMKNDITVVHTGKSVICQVVRFSSTTGRSFLNWNFVEIDCDVAKLRHPMYLMLSICWVVVLVVMRCVSSNYFLINSKGDVTWYGIHYKSGRLARSLLYDVLIISKWMSHDRHQSCNYVCHVRISCWTKSALLRLIKYSRLNGRRFGLVRCFRSCHLQKKCCHYLSTICEKVCDSWCQVCEVNWRGWCVWLSSQRVSGYFRF